MTEAGTPRDRALGGYRPEAGRNSHVADEPVRIPVPSLLRSLLTDHLDPGYAAAAERRAATGDSARRAGPRLADGAWLLVGAAAVSVVFVTAAQHAVSMAPATTQTQHVLSANARTAESRTVARCNRCSMGCAIDPWKSRAPRPRAPRRTPDAHGVSMLIE